MASATKAENQASIGRLNQLLISHGTPVPITGTDFMPKMDMAMEKMHHAMMVEYTVDPDYDFAEKMIHHHQGAIDMARIELELGTDSLMKGEAQEMITMQEEEIIQLSKFLHEHGETEKIKKH